MMMTWKKAVAAAVAISAIAAPRAVKGAPGSLKGVFLREDGENAAPHVIHPLEGVKAAVFRPDGKEMTYPEYDDLLAIVSGGDDDRGPLVAPPNAEKKKNKKKHRHSYTHTHTQASGSGDAHFSSGGKGRVKEDQCGFTKSMDDTLKFIAEYQKNPEKVLATHTHKQLAEKVAPLTDRVNEIIAIQAPEFKGRVSHKDILELSTPDPVVSPMAMVAVSDNPIDSCGVKITEVVEAVIADVIGLWISYPVKDAEKAAEDLVEIKAAKVGWEAFYDLTRGGLKKVIKKGAKDLIKKGQAKYEKSELAKIVNILMKPLFVLVIQLASDAFEFTKVLLHSENWWMRILDFIEIAAQIIAFLFTDGVSMMLKMIDWIAQAIADVTALINSVLSAVDACEDTGPVPTRSPTPPPTMADETTACLGLDDHDKKLIKDLRNDWETQVDWLGQQHAFQIRVNLPNSDKETLYKKQKTLLEAQKATNKAEAEAVKAIEDLMKSKKMETEDLNTLKGANQKIGKLLEQQEEKIGDLVVCASAGKCAANKEQAGLKFLHTTMMQQAGLFKEIKPVLDRLLKEICEFLDKHLSPPGDE